MMLVFFLMLICFNPRICKRCDANSFYNIDSGLVSIHASVKDATTYRERLDSFNPVSIHASVKDATQSVIFVTLLHYLFQSTHL